MTISEARKSPRLGDGVAIGITQEVIVVDPLVSRSASLARTLARGPCTVTVARSALEVIGSLLRRPTANLVVVVRSELDDFPSSELAEFLRETFPNLRVVLL